MTNVSKKTRKLKGPRKESSNANEVHSIKNPKIKHHVTEPVAQLKGSSNESVQKKTVSTQSDEQPVYENFSALEPSNFKHESHEDKIQSSLDLGSALGSDSAQDYVNLKQVSEPLHVKTKDQEWADFVEEFDYETRMLKNDLQDLKIHAEYVGKSLVKKLTTYASKRLQEKNYTSESAQMIADNLVELERGFLSDIKTPNDILRETDTFK